MSSVAYSLRKAEGRFLRKRSLFSFKQTGGGGIGVRKLSFERRGGVGSCTVFTATPGRS